MSTRRKLFFAAFGAGMAISITLTRLEASHYTNFVAMLQMPGFLAGALIWGVHSGGAWFEALMLSVNAAVYGVSLLIFYGLVKLALRI
jgi:hypothetical protein